MFQAHISEKEQTFKIEDRDGNVVAMLKMPFSQVPNPGKAELMKNASNQEAWGRIFDLVKAANNA